MQDQRLNIPAANTEHTPRSPSNIRRYLVAGLSCTVVATLCVVVFSSSGNYQQTSVSDHHPRSFIPQGYPSQAPSFSVTSSPTYSPTAECVQDWGQCGGTGYNGPTCCCNPDYSCVYNNDYYSQCIPTPPTKAPTFAITPPPTNSPTTKPPTTKTPTNSPTYATTPAPTAACVQDWGQCGGSGYNGPTCCCSPDYSCVYNSEYYSQCIPTPPTKAPTFAITPSPTKSPTTKPPATQTPAPTSKCVEDYGQCGGNGYEGSTNCCSPDFSCVYNNDYYSQCIPKTSTPSPTFAVTSPPSTQCAQDYGQCGGIGYEGPAKCCSDTFYCYYNNDYYSQCVPKNY